jgi:hypothetical protein
MCHFPSASIADQKVFCRLCYNQHPSWFDTAEIRESLFVLLHRKRAYETLTEKHYRPL